MPYFLRSGYWLLNHRHIIFLDLSQLNNHVEKDYAFLCIFSAERSGIHLDICIRNESYIRLSYILYKEIHLYTDNMSPQQKFKLTHMFGHVIKKINRTCLISCLVSGYASIHTAQKRESVYDLVLIIINF